MGINKIVTIVLVCFAIFVVFAVITNIMIFKTGIDHIGFNSDSNGEYIEIDENKIVDLNGVDNIEIDVVSADVDIFESDKDLDVTLKASGFSANNKVKLVIREAGSSVYIKVEHTKKFFNFDASRRNLLVGIPSGFDGEININTVSGDIDGSESLSNDLDLLYTKTTSGDVELNFSSIGLLEAKSVSGEINIDSKINKSVKASTTSGDIEIANVADGCDRVYAKSVSGDVDIDYDSACETEIKTTSGSIKLDISGDEAIDLNFHSTSGDMDGNVNVNDGGVKFDVKSVSGNLKFD